MMVSVQRRYIRYNFINPVEYFLPPESNTIHKAITTNISSAGICMLVFDPLTTGQKINIRSDLSICTKQATVRWSHRADTFYYRTGLEFESQGEAGEKPVHTLLTSLEKLSSLENPVQEIKLEYALNALSDKLISGMKGKKFSSIHHELLRTREELSALSSLMNTVGSSLEVNEVVKRALKEIVRITAPDVSFFYLKANEKMLLKEIWKKHRSPLLPEIKDVGVCLCGLAVRKGEAFYSKDIHRDPRCTLDECKQAGVKSFAALPLCGYSGMLGVLSLASFKERDFSQQSAFLEILASHIAISLQNAFLHEESERYATDLEQQIEQRRMAEDTLRRHQRELTKRVRELEEYYTIAIGRELRIKELGEQIDALKVQLEKQKL